SACTFVCGNGSFDTDETCDDGNVTSGDGCSASCRIEPGWLCSGRPSRCTPLCGDGLVRGGETCDDGNVTSGDGCSANCRTEPGWHCGTPGLPCAPFAVVIDGPPHGTFTAAGSATVTGHYTTLLPGQASVTINGAAANTVDPLSRTFSHTLT